MTRKKCKSATAKFHLRYTIVNLIPVHAEPLKTKNFVNITEHNDPSSTVKSTYMTPHEERW